VSCRGSSWFQSSQIIVRSGHRQMPWHYGIIAADRSVLSLKATVLWIGVIVVDVCPAA
jgi:hypothetical protein